MVEAQLLFGLLGDSFSSFVDLEANVAFSKSVLELVNEVESLTIKY